MRYITREMPCVFRVRIVFIACGTNDAVVKMAARYPMNCAIIFRESFCVDKSSLISIRYDTLKNWIIRNSSCTSSCWQETSRRCVSPMPVTLRQILTMWRRVLTIWREVLTMLSRVLTTFSWVSAMFSRWFPSFSWEISRGKLIATVGQEPTAGGKTAAQSGYLSAKAGNHTNRFGLELQRCGDEITKPG